MIGKGTIVNVLAVIIGSCIGIFFNGGLKKRFQEILMQSLGLSTIFIGASGALKGMLVIKNSAIETTGTMMMIVSIVLGALIGEIINIEKRFDSLGEWLKCKFKNSDDPKFVEGFVSASLVTCIGAMAIIGPLQDGLAHDASTLYTKSILDFVTVIIFASAFGKGVIFSAIPLGIFQGFITVSAHFIQPFLTRQLIQNLSTVGYVLILGVGVNMAFGKKFRVANMIPALLVAVIYSLIM